MSGPRVLSYGPHGAQCLDLHLPVGPGPHPVVVLIHGADGCRRSGRGSMRPLAVDLTRRGFAVLNADYRRVGEHGGGWPGTLLDAVAMVAQVAEAPWAVDLDGGRIALVGHGAGGQLALWAAAWWGAFYQPTEASRPDRVEVRAVVSLAGLTDLAAAARAGVGGAGPPAAVGLLDGGPGDVAGRYRLGSPIELLPLGAQVAQLILHGDEDDVVPVGQSIRYVRCASAAGDRVRLARIPGAGHLEVLDPGHDSWRLVVRFLREQLAG